MFYIARVSTNTYSTPTGSSSLAPTILPFPLHGKFKIRIVGWEFVSTDVHNVSVCKVVSRSLLNPMQPDKVFQFIPDRITADLSKYHHVSRGFKASGWWSIELFGSIDLLCVPDDDYDSNQLPPFTLLLHLELEREGSGTEIEKGHLRK